MIKRWIRMKKLELAYKWARQFGLMVVEIKMLGSSAYIVDANGSWRKLPERRK